MKVILVYNPGSGSALSVDELRQKFEKAALPIEAFVDIGDDLSVKLRPWIERRDVIIAAIGGDGTHSTVANELAGTDALFMPLPGGTLNHFTRDLGIPRDVDEALSGLALNRKNARVIDLAKVNDRVFINNSSIGIYPTTLQLRERLEKSAFSKWFAAVIASFQALIRYRTLTVSVNGETFKTPFLFVGNNDYHLEDPINAGRTVMTEGQLSAYALVSASRRGLLKVFFAAIFGQLQSTEELKVWHTGKLTVSAKKSAVKISCDGELGTLKSPLRYEITPGALHVIGNWQSS